MQITTILSTLQENFQLILGILAGALVILGILLFFLTGIVPVRKGRVAIIEKTGLYIGVFYKTKYFFPIIYRRAGYYRLGPQKLIKTLPNQKKCIMVCEIENVIIYHYSGHNIDHAIQNIYSLNDEVNFEVMQKGFLDIGLKLIKIEEYIEKQK